MSRTGVTRPTNNTNRIASRFRLWCYFASMFSALTNPASPIQKIIRQRLPWIFLALTILLVIGVRLRLRDVPLERDEG